MNFWRKKMDNRMEAYDRDAEAALVESLRKPDHLVIFARRWFHNRNGNTYHSVDLYVDGQFLAYSPYTYGYDNQYMHTAFLLLKQYGYFDSSLERPNGSPIAFDAFVRWCGEPESKAVIIEVNVQRRKDL
jgi:hypothetical protein